MCESLFIKSMEFTLPSRSCQFSRRRNGSRSEQMGPWCPCSIEASRNKAPSSPQVQRSGFQRLSCGSLGHFYDVECYWKFVSLPVVKSFLGFWGTVGVQFIGSLQFFDLDAVFANFLDYLEEGFPDGGDAVAEGLFVAPQNSGRQKSGSVECRSQEVFFDTVWNGILCFKLKDFFLQKNCSKLLCGWRIAGSKDR